MDKNINKFINDKIFKEFNQKIAVYLHTVKTKNGNFDPFRNTGYKLTKSNPIFVKAVVRDVYPDKSILKELGVVITGAKEVIINKKDLNVFKLARRIVIDDIDYTLYNKSLGNKITLINLPFNFSKIVIYRMDK